MPIGSSVLILDDGELETVHRLLRGMDVDVARLQGADIGASVHAPIDLLITAGKRTLTDMPDVIQANDAGPGPVWVCMHNQDFLPMRERLKGMGVHFLLQNALDEDSRKRFLRQLLRKGVERRRNPRLPVGGEIEYGEGAPSQTGKLVELAVDGCQFLSAEPFDLDSSLCIRLPAGLGGGGALDLTGRVQREAEPALHAGNEVFLTAICFDALEAGERLIIESAIRGERIGTRVSALAAIPGSAAEPELDEAAEPEPEATHEDRRSAPRQVYGRAVRVLGGGKPMLGSDLSMSGVRLEDGDGLEEGTRVSVALFGTPRDEPVVVEAIVTRARPGAEMALQFGALSSSQTQDLEKLMGAAPILDALDQPTAEAGRTVVAELRESSRPS